MRIVTWNVNGLRAALKKGFMAWLAEMQPDVVCLQEVRADPTQVDGRPWQALGYAAYWNPAERPGYSGVAMLIRKDASGCGPSAVRAGLGVREFDAEGRVLVAAYPGFDLFNVYFPSGQRDRERVEFKLRFYAALLELLDGLRERGRPVVVCGDFNTAHRAIDLARPRQNVKTSGFLPEERAWIDIYLAHGLVDVFRALHPGEPGHYTWWSTVTHARERNVGWRLDYLLVSEVLLPAIRASTILPQVAGSDHCPVLLELASAQPPAIERALP